MKTGTIRMGCLVIGLLAAATFSISGANGLPAVEEGHRSGMLAKLTLPGGATRTVKLDGVGCSASMCSRTSIQSRGERAALVRTWLDDVAAIRETTESDALFVMKDGTRRRMSLVTAFRVLYLTSGSGAAEKLDLAKVQSIELLAPAN